MELAVIRRDKAYRTAPVVPRAQRHAQGGERPAITLAQSPLFRRAETAGYPEFNRLKAPKIQGSKLRTSAYEHGATAGGRPRPQGRLAKVPAAHTNRLGGSILDGNRGKRQYPVACQQCGDSVAESFVHHIGRNASYDSDRCQSRPIVTGGLDGNNRRRSCHSRGAYQLCGWMMRYPETNF
jgi:hypothetical protein